VREYKGEESHGFRKTVAERTREAEERVQLYQKAMAQYCRDFSEAATEQGGEE